MDVLSHAQAFQDGVMYSVSDGLTHIKFFRK